MPQDRRAAPHVMLSSSFKDLEEHRRALLDIIEKSPLKAKAMENDAAKPEGIIESSLQMVADSSIYIGIVGPRYGQVIECAENPQGLSVTELEFEEALKRGLPMLLFVMDLDEHPLRAKHVEDDPNKKQKLEAFRQRVMSPERVCASFTSLDDFEKKATRSLYQFLLNPKASKKESKPRAKPKGAALPLKPGARELKAVPPYSGSHQFLGRASQLTELDAWAADPTDPVFLYHAIGGAGKSILTWEWLHRQQGGPWAGRFWYSFYEGGATMGGFCREALAYVEGKSADHYKDTPLADLRRRLLEAVRQQPWLFVLDGVERLLVNYHGLDAGRREHKVGQADEMAKRDPRHCVLLEDDELLRELVTAAPSKLLLTSRLVPLKLLNSAGQPVPGLRLKPLPGLTPLDAEEMFRQCGVRGDGAAMRSYLDKNCGCHPLTIGALAGVVVSYSVKDGGNFDAWAKDPHGSGRLPVARLKLEKKQNHILKYAVGCVPKDGRAVLDLLAFWSESADGEFLEALNPLRPPAPEEVEEPTKPEDTWRWRSSSEEEKEARRAAYHQAREEFVAYQLAVEKWRNSAAYRDSSGKLARAVKDLEARGLLQFEANRYDLHPVVRSIVFEQLGASQKQRHGQSVLNHLNSRQHDPFEQARRLEDLQVGLHLVRTLLQLGRFDDAADAYSGPLAIALWKIEAHRQGLELLLPFFEGGWAQPRAELDDSAKGYLLNDAANFLQRLGQYGQAQELRGFKLRFELATRHWSGLHVALSNVSWTLAELNRQRTAALCRSLALDFAGELDQAELFGARLDCFITAAIQGDWPAADALWQALDPMGRDWSEATYRQGYAEYWQALALFWRGGLTPEVLDNATRLAEQSGNQEVHRGLLRLRGEWHISRADWPVAERSLTEAVERARQKAIPNANSETMLAFAQLHTGRLTKAAAPAEADRLAALPELSDRWLAELYLALNDRAQAQHHALAAYEYAWADGEPYVRRYELTQAQALLDRLGVPAPQLPTRDTTAEDLPWLDEVKAAIAELKAENKKKRKT